MFMIVCPNCNHQNPDGAVQCEACYTPLPEMTSCPNCGSTVQTDASFCGQCGFNLKAAFVHETSNGPINHLNPGGLPDLIPASPQVVPGSVVEEQFTPPEKVLPGEEHLSPEIAAAPAAPPVLESELLAAPNERSPIPRSPEGKTQLQQQTVRLLHVQTNTLIEFPQNLDIIHLGKPNDRIPPDIDVSGFPNSEIVSRIHADIRLEGDAYYIEDVGSSNGTYINNLPLPVGNRHRLRPGDRIALGKGDKVTFLFQLS